MAGQAAASKVTGPPGRRAARPQPVVTPARPLHPAATDGSAASTQDVTCQVLSDAAGRMRLKVPLMRGSAARAVAIEQSVDFVFGVRAVHSYPRTGAVLIWYKPGACEHRHLLAAIRSAAAVGRTELASRAPRSADVTGGDLLRMVVGGVALLLLGGRRYAFRRPPVLGPGGRLVATGVTIFTGYPSCGVLWPHYEESVPPAPTRWSPQQRSRRCCCGKT
jgi:hypothetical protein